jgi:hypothetical protein
MSEIVKLNTKFLSDAAEAGIEIVPPPTDPDVVLALAVVTAKFWARPVSITA